MSLLRGKKWDIIGGYPILAPNPYAGIYLVWLYFYKISPTDKIDF